MTRTLSISARAVISSCARTTRRATSVIRAKNISAKLACAKGISFLTERASGLPAGTAFGRTSSTWGDTKIKLSAPPRNYFLRNKMDAKYIVFMNGIAGMQLMRVLSADSLEEAIQNIQEGCLGCRMPSQNWMYYIYSKHHMNIPLHGTRYDTYKYCKSVAGCNVEKPKNGYMTYALTHQSSTAWFFTDSIFENIDLK